jgi:DNA-binding CsgD family transcriptional regulator
MQEGVRHGDQCVSFIDDLEPAGGRQPAQGPPIPDDARRWHLGAYPSPDAGLSSGELSLEQMSLRVAARGSTEGESALLRAAGEMSSVQHEPGAKKLSVYESGVTAILAAMPGLVLCMYDLDRFERGMLVEVLKIHSTVLLDGAVLHNPHCVAPSTYPEPTPGAVAQRSPDRTRRWLSLTRAEVRIAQLVACGMTNRATADVLILSPHTVDAHLKHMYLKLGIHSRVELTVLALRHGRAWS